MPDEDIALVEHRGQSLVDVRFDQPLKACDVRLVGGVRQREVGIGGAAPPERAHFRLQLGIIGDDVGRFEPRPLVAPIDIEQRAGIRHDVLERDPDACHRRLRAGVEEGCVDVLFLLGAKIEREQPEQQRLVSEGPLEERAGLRVEGDLASGATLGVKQPDPQPLAGPAIGRLAAVQLAVALDLVLEPVDQREVHRPAKDHPPMLAPVLLVRL